MNIRRTAHRNVGARLCEETGVVTTTRSRAAAHRDEMRTNAMLLIGRR